MSSVVTQLQRAGAPGVPERVFYMYLPVESMRAMNPRRGEPPLVIPQAKYFTVRVPFAPEDLQAAARSLVCHRSQFTPEVVQRVVPAPTAVLGTVRQARDEPVPRRPMLESLEQVRRIMARPDE